MDDASRLMSLPLDEVLDQTTSKETYIRIDAKCELRRRILLVPGMMDDVVRGVADAICAQCGQGFDGREIKSAMAHIGANGICRNGFKADRQCDCGKTFDTITEANNHRIRLGCLFYRLAKEKERKALYCEPCAYQAPDKKALADHLKTKAHHKATHPDEFLCVPCDHRSRCKTEHEAHLASKSHKQVVEPVVLRCEVCAVNFRCKAEQDRHLAGKQHLYKADPAKRPTLTCELCGITRPSQAQYQAHLATAKHRKKAGQQACLEDPSSPDDADASGSLDRQPPSPTRWPPLVC